VPLKPTGSFAIAANKEAFESETEALFHIFRKFLVALKRDL
jgi:hypothetical protein